MPVKYYVDYKFKRQRLSETARRFPPEYLALQKKWYALLKSQGFRELEFFHTDGAPTNALLLDSITRMQQLYTSETMHYYAKARWYLHHGELNEVEAKVWEAHARGATLIVAAAAIGKSKDTAARMVRKIRARMLADNRYEQIEASDIAALAERLLIKVTK